jgi:hypothetical protein
MQVLELACLSRADVVDVGEARRLEAVVVDTLTGGKARDTHHMESHCLTTQGITLTR